jgi:hypothetical protein
VKSHRHAAGPENPLRELENAGSGILSATLTYYRAVQDAISEAAFFQLYGHMFTNLMADRSPSLAREQAAGSRQAETVSAALAQIEDGGYPAALARVAFLLKGKDNRPLPLSRLQLKAELVKEYADLLPDTAPDEQRRIRGVQEIIVGESREAALATLPKLLADAADAARLETLLDRLVHDKRIVAAMPTAEQKATLERIRKVLGTTQLPSLVTKKLPVKRPASIARKTVAGVAAGEVKPKAAAKPKRATPAKASAAKVAEG